MEGTFFEPIFFIEEIDETTISIQNNRKYFSESYINLLSSCFARIFETELQYQNLTVSDLVLEPQSHPIGFSVSFILDDGDDKISFNFEISVSTLIEDRFLSFPYVSFRLTNKEKSQVKKIIFNSSEEAQLSVMALELIASVFQQLDRRLTEKFMEKHCLSFEEEFVNSDKLGECLLKFSENLDDSTQQYKFLCKDENQDCEVIVATSHLCSISEVFNIFHKKDHDGAEPDKIYDFQETLSPETLENIFKPFLFNLPPKTTDSFENLSIQQYLVLLDYFFSNEISLAYSKLKTLLLFLKINSSEEVRLLIERQYPDNLTNFIISYLVCVGKEQFIKENIHHVPTSTKDFIITKLWKPK